jgi:hypothetical protein
VQAFPNGFHINLAQSSPSGAGARHRHREHWQPDGRSGARRDQSGPKLWGEHAKSQHLSEQSSIWGVWTVTHWAGVYHQPGHADRNLITHVILDVENAGFQSGLARLGCRNALLRIWRSCVPNSGAVRSTLSLTQRHALLVVFFNLLLGEGTPRTQIQTYMHSCTRTNLTPVSVFSWNRRRTCGQDGGLSICDPLPQATTIITQLPLPQLQLH